MKANNQLIDDEELLTFGTVSVLALTNANGDPVLLPNDGPTNGAAERSFNAYVPNIAYSSLNFESSLAPLCSSDLYEKHVDLIQNVTDRLLPGETFESVIPRQVLPHFLFFLFSLLKRFISTRWMFTMEGLPGWPVLT